MNKNSMLSGSILKGVMLFAFPIMLSQLLQYNYSFVDNIIVGRYAGNAALAAVGNVGAINSFVIGAALGLTNGFTIPVAHAFGAGDRRAVAKYAGSSIVVAFLIGLVIVVTAHILSTPLLKLIGTPDEIIGLSASYVNILYYAVPIQMLSNNFTAISRAVGESKKPLYFYAASGLVNLGLDLLFVKHFGWGVKGAAAATLLSHCVAALLTGIYVFRFNKNVDIKKEDLRPNSKTAWSQIKLGIPVSLQFTITSVGSMALQSAVNSFGANVMAGFTAAARVESLTNIPMSGFGVAAQTFSGQNFGAKNSGRIIKGTKMILAFGIMTSVLMSLILYFAGPFAVSLFMKEQNAEIMTAAKAYIKAVAQCYSLVAVLLVLRNSLQGMGFTYANAIAGAGELFGRLAIAFIFTRLIGFSAVCYAGPAAWLLADIPLAIIYIHKLKLLKTGEIYENKHNSEKQQGHRFV
ncbi:MAG: MATE family efflux transporter [Eubacterium sp.]|nr:MATE family efflux transporter [Eubacterium sp.]